MTRTEEFEGLRPPLFAIACRIPGSVGEDAVHASQTSRGRCTPHDRSARGNDR